MFDLFAPSHLLLIAIAILLFVGPKDLPKFMHAVGKWTRKARRLADDFHKSLDNMEQQGQLEELRKEISALRNPSRLDDDTDTSSRDSLQTPPADAADGQRTAIAAVL